MRREQEKEKDREKELCSLAKKGEGSNTYIFGWLGGRPFYHARYLRVDYISSN